MNGPPADPSASLKAALDRAEAAARRRRRLLHPVRQLRPVLHRWRGPTEVTCRLFTGQSMRVVLPEIVATALYRDAYVEAPLSRVLVERLRPGMVFVDVGAHYGYHTLLASLLVEPGGVVVAFEPGRDAYRLLEKNVGCTNNVRIENAALADEPGMVELHDFGRCHSALNTILPGPRVPAHERRTLRAETYRVQAMTLDGYAASIGLSPDVVKLDAEGAELAILRGMRRLLRDTAPLVAIETGDYDGMASPRTAASVELLESLGYQCFEYADGLRPHIRRSCYGYGNLYFQKPD